MTNNAESELGVQFVQTCLSKNLGSFGYERLSLLKWKKTIARKKCRVCSMEHTSDKFQKGIREIFLPFQGGISKMYKIYSKT